MKIVLDLQGAQSESRFRGIGRLSKALANAIIDRANSHDIHLLFNLQLKGNFDELYVEFSQKVGHDNIHVFKIPQGVAEQSPENAWRSRCSTIIRESFIENLKADICHVSSLFEGFLDDSVTSVHHAVNACGVAVTLYDLIPWVDQEKYLQDDIYKNFYLRKIQNLKRADLLLAISEHAKREAVDYLDIDHNNISVIYAGVDPYFTKLASLDGNTSDIKGRFCLKDKFILHVGAADPRKNVEFLVRAFSALPENLRLERQMVFAGRLSDMERRKILLEAARFGLALSDIVFLGVVSDHDLRLLYNLAEMVVFPSLHEGFGLPALEGMACGAPVLAADATSLPEVVGRADALFDPRVVDSLTKRMVRVMEDDGFRNELIEWGPSRASGFTWQEAARKTIDAFEHLHDKRRQNTKTIHIGRRPLMAFVSPLPDDRTGIADHSSELLRELACHYDIECIISGTHVTDPWVLANFPRRDLVWFESNARKYDRIVYCMGNSAFHAHMIDLVVRFPGVVILHDIYLGNLYEWMCSTGKLRWEELFNEIYRSHGLWGLQLERQSGVRAVIDRLPLSGAIFRHAHGVIVHSKHAQEVACEFFGDGVGDLIRIVPLLRAPLHGLDKTAARRKLNIPQDEFVVCSFGLLTPLKLSHLIIEAWSLCASSRRARMVFVGGITEHYRPQIERLVDNIDAALTIDIVGHVDGAVYKDWLAAADLAVQLRIQSRGETSAAVFDCMGAGLPVIVNDYGSARDLPDDCVYKIPPSVYPFELADHIDHLITHEEQRRETGRKARNYVLSLLDPRTVSAQFYELVESFYRCSSAFSFSGAVSAISEINAAVAPTEADLSETAASIYAFSKARQRKQLLCDVTVLAQQDSMTGIQRVVRAILNQLLENPPEGFYIEPVVIRGGDLFYARSFAAERLKLRVGDLADDKVVVAKGDHYLMLDWVPDRLGDLGPWLEDFRRVGGHATIVIYDLLPLRIPQFFPPWMEELGARWFEQTIRFADCLACISRSVADDAASYAQILAPDRKMPLSIGYFHIGADLDGSLPSQGLPDDAEKMLSGYAERPTFLTVGTIEPRKGHRQVLDAVDLLWREGVDVGLVIVGKEGWMIEDVTARIRNHTEYGKRLHWLSGVSDEMLARVYVSCSAIIAASEGEGFGLPLIEAAGYGIPVIARNLAVFQEVAGRHAFYFDGLDGVSLAAALKKWLELDAIGAAPVSSDMPHLDWATATQQLMDVVQGKNIYKTLYE
jgi:glycosyltransferase involved in cell wall biosynthesis